MLTRQISRKSRVAPAIRDILPKNARVDRGEFPRALPANKRGLARQCFVELQRAR